MIENDLAMRLSSESVSSTPLYLNHIATYDWLIALRFGWVDDGQPERNWREVNASFGYLLDSPDGVAVGFKVLDFSEFDPDDPEVEPIWSEPRFEVPTLGLQAASAGEIVLATRALFGEHSTINREFFDRAVELKGEEALAHWLACLQAGDSMAHFALGYTLLELGRLQEAYRHLRYYTEIAPTGAWNWCWFGKAAAEIGERDEAARAFRTAITLERGGVDETDAPELLAALGAG